MTTFTQQKKQGLVIIPVPVSFCQLSINHRHFLLANRSSPLLQHLEHCAGRADEAAVGAGNEYRQEDEHYREDDDHDAGRVEDERREELIVHPCRPHAGEHQNHQHGKENPAEQRQTLHGLRTHLPVLVGRLSGKLLQ